MPAAIEYIPPTDPRRNQFAAELTREKTKRRTHYKQAVKYYTGEHDRTIARPELTEWDDQTTVNLVQMAADRTVSFLFPAVPKIIIDPASFEDTPEEAYIHKVLLYNGGLKTFTKWALRGFLSGHSFIRVTLPRFEGGLPTITVLDPTTVTVFWAADDVGNVLWYTYDYDVGDTSYIEDIVHTAEDTWLVHTYRSTGKRANNSIFQDVQTPHSFGLNDKFEPGVYGFVSTVAHTSAIPPIVDVAHLPHPNDFYGLSEFTQKDLQDAINHLSTIRNRVARENVEPVDVITGADADEIENSGGIVTIASAAARVQRLEMKGDLAGITQTIDKMTETYLAIARVVILRGEAKDLQRVTNAAVRTLFLDALSKNEILKSAYGEAIENIARLILEMGVALGQISTATDTISVKFGMPLPTDDVEVAQINSLAIKDGYMQRRTAAERLGLDWAFESPGIERDLTRLEKHDKMMRESGETPQGKSGEMPKGNNSDE